MQFEKRTPDQANQVNNNSSNDPILKILGEDFYEDLKKMNYSKQEIKNISNEIKSLGFNSANDLFLEGFYLNEKTKTFEHPRNGPNNVIYLNDDIKKKKRELSQEDENQTGLDCLIKNGLRINEKGKKKGNWN